ncbi:hypothetical protein BCU68_13100 [Vibrio sp. 10N.286.49.B3]|uniref:RNA-binding S4 domain-containing protein n=1 Tax=Vibrio sp. 10N.286.49.B3 TaxID=1880855 RepID=UPI000C86314C|nr:RNA-binding S4 domain-containing protein [Vibrio sp. 10N.286.49.B3]PMH43780.1 hypothetical protein BCU68_13100 [Vibrio sp. 10N.286.49.B3]
MNHEIDHDDWIEPEDEFAEEGEEIEIEAIGVDVTCQPIELYKVFKIANLVGGGGEAKHIIAEGYVAVNGELETRKRRKMYDGDFFEFNQEYYVVVCDQPVQEVVDNKEAKQKEKARLDRESQIKARKAKKEARKQKKASQAAEAEQQQAKVAEKTAKPEKAKKAEKSKDISHPFSASAKKSKPAKPEQKKKAPQAKQESTSAPERDAKSGRNSIDFF